MLKKICFYLYIICCLATGVSRPAPGNLDTTAFNFPNGYNVGANVGNSSTVTSVGIGGGAAVCSAMSAAGDVYYVGSLTTPNYTSFPALNVATVIVAYNPDGSYNQTFNGGAPLQTFQGYCARAMETYQSGTYAGKIVVTGMPYGITYPLTMGEMITSPTAPGFVARLNADGTPDTTFAPFGLIVLPEGFFYASSVVIQPDNKIVVAGNGTTGMSAVGNCMLARYNTDGTLDTTFNGTGFVQYTGPDTTMSSCYILAVGLQSDGTIVVAGAYQFATDLLIAQFSSTGTFINKTLTPGTGNGAHNTRAQLKGLYVFPEGSSYQDYIMTVGGLESQGVVNAIRFTPSLAIDTSFYNPDLGPGNYYYPELNTVMPEQLAFAAAVCASDVDGYTQVCGSFLANDIIYNGFVLRFDNVGTITDSNPILSPGYPTVSPYESLAVDIVQIASDAYFVAGSTIFPFSDPDHPSKVLAAVVNQSCVADHSFNETGTIITTIVALSEDEGTDCAAQSAGQIVQVGSGGNNQFVARRWYADGTLDTTFNSNQQVIAETRFSLESGSVVSVAIESNDSIVACGTLSALAGGYVVRYLSGGSDDATFGTGGLFTFNVGTALSLGASSDSLYDLVLDGSGNSYVAGTTSAGSAFTSIFIAKITAAGVLDSSFNGSGIAIVPNGGVNCTGTVIGFQGSNCIVGGYNGNGYIVSARYTTAGTLDATFGSAGVSTLYVGSSDSIVEAMAITSAGALVLAGSNGGDSLLVQLTIHGAFDTTNFNSPNGYVIEAIGSTSSNNDVVLQSDGSIITTGQSDTSILVAKYTSTGTLNPLFAAPNGYVVTSIGTIVRGMPTRSPATSSLGNALLLNQGTNKIIVAGATTYTNPSGKGFVQLQYDNNANACPIIVQQVFCSGNQTPALALGTQCCQRVWIEKVGNQIVADDFSLVPISETFEDGTITLAEFYAAGSYCACN